MKVKRWIGYHSKVDGCCFLQSINYNKIHPLRILWILKNSHLLRGRKILLLGAGKWQVPYLLKAKELGLQVFATDWDPNAPGAKIADHFEPISLTDTENSLAFAKSHGIEAILTAADIGVPTAAFIANKLDLPYHDPELANEATNKGAMRGKALRLGLAGPKMALVTNLDNAVTQANNIGYPKNF